MRVTTRETASRAAACIAAFILLAVVRVEAEAPTVDTVRQLYASAAYEDALAMVDGLSANASGADRPTLGLYRVLCLVALARTPDAERAIETLVAESPLYRPPADEMPPRVRTAFGDIRKRVLPGIIQQQYQQAKTAFDRQDYAPAKAAFERVLELLDDVDVAASVAQPPLSDLKTLTIGFQQLSAKAVAPPPPPPAPEPPVAPPVLTRDFRKVYTVADAEVVAPVAVRQAFPPFPGKIVTPVTGMVEVVIDATGAVEDATIRVSIHEQYDRLILAAARRWQYRPATVEGVPVRFLKSLQVNLTPTAR